MNDFLTSQIAIKRILIILSLVVVFHLLVITGVVPFDCMGKA